MPGIRQSVARSAVSTFYIPWSSDIQCFYDLSLCRACCIGILQDRNSASQNLQGFAKDAAAFIPSERKSDISALDWFTPHLDGQVQGKKNRKKSFSVLGYLTTETKEAVCVLNSVLCFFVQGGFASSVIAILF